MTAYIRDNKVYFVAGILCALIGGLLSLGYSDISADVAKVEAKSELNEDKISKLCEDVAVLLAMAKADREDTKEIKQMIKELSK